MPFTYKWCRIFFSWKMEKFSSKKVGFKCSLEWNHSILLNDWAQCKCPSEKLLGIAVLTKEGINQSLVAWTTLIKTKFTLSTKNILFMQDLAMEINKSSSCQLHISWGMAKFCFLWCYFGFSFNGLVGFENHYLHSFTMLFSLKVIGKENIEQISLLGNPHFI